MFWHAGLIFDVCITTLLKSCIWNLKLRIVKLPQTYSTELQHWFSCDNKMPPCTLRESRNSFDFKRDQLKLLIIYSPLKATELLQGHSSDSCCPLRGTAFKYWTSCLKEGLLKLRRLHLVGLMWSLASFPSSSVCSATDAPDFLRRAGQEVLMKTR